MLLFPGLKPVLNASTVIVNPVRAVFPGLVLSTKRSFYSINRLNAENKINDIANTSKEASSSVQMFKPPEFSQFKDSYQKTMREQQNILDSINNVPFYAFLYPGGVMNPLLDASLSSIFLIYLQYGFTSCIIDYIPKEKYPRWHKLALYCLYGGSMLSLYGIYELETKNNGFVDLVKKLWNENDDHLYIFGRN